MKVNGKNVLTHRVAWELANGPIPDGLWVLHHCDNPPCGQTDPSEGYPDGHLFLGTNAENSADRDAKGRHDHAHNELKTHCKYGHRYSAENTYTYQGSRHCRTCMRAANARCYASKRLAGVA